MDQAHIYLYGATRAPAPTPCDKLARWVGIEPT